MREKNNGYEYVPYQHGEKINKWWMCFGEIAFNQKKEGKWRKPWLLVCCYNEEASFHKTVHNVVNQYLQCMRVEFIPPPKKKPK